MVKVREEHPIQDDGQVDISAWLQRIEASITLPNQESQETLLSACERAKELEHTHGKGHAWANGASSYRTGLEMAEILANLQQNTETLVAAILYRAVREGKVELQVVRTEFGDVVARLIEGVMQMAAIATLRNDSSDDVFGRQSEEQAENVRKMLVAMVDDVRVALIKLAERTCAIRAVKNASAKKRQAVAREVADVYAPLAHRLGIGHIKWELEDLAFRYLQPEAYKSIAKQLDGRRLDREQYIEEVIKQLQEQLQQAGIDAEINGRAKHILSIWKKMQRKDISFSQVYDVRAVRILVTTVRDCYAVLGIVHNLWRNIPNEFDDYIASPKENGYRSLHTAVIGPESKVLEVQIRTNAMHDDAEYGVCAHWLYKGTDKDGIEDSYEKKIAWLRQVLAWHEELGGDALKDDLAGPVSQDRIYVFTPEGHVVDLPQKATPLDFAYKIHTDIGHRCRGAIVNGRIVPLNHPLKTSDQVQVLTGKREAPSRDWLSPALEYLQTARARSKVQHWFKLQARDQNIAEGRALLDKEFKRLALLDLNFDALAKALNMVALDDLYAAVGASDIGVAQVLNAAQRLLKIEKEPEVQIKRRTESEAGSDIYIDGVGNLLSHIAGCCKPVPGDAISGYITLGKGVSIHRQDCHTVLQLQADEPERIIKVDWGAAPENYYSVEILIEAFDRYGLLKDVTTMLDRERINVTAMQTISDKRKNTVDMLVTIEIKSFAELSRILARLNQLPNISSARRKLS